MKHLILISVSSALLLSGCEETTLFDDQNIVMLAPESGDATITDAGEVASTLVNTNVGNEIDADGNGYAFVTGLFPDDPGAAGFAGITDTTDLGTQPTTDSATMTGTYRLTQLDGLALNANDRPTATSTRSESDQITLTADFEAATLTGTQGDLSIDGTMDAGVLSGTVTFDGLEGTLRGAIGATDAVGAFDGADDDTVYAGGFFVRE
jgi:hypothetical protein